MKKAFYRLKKFYILVFVLIILISLGYIFLHRSLGLILWDRLYYEEERDNAKRYNSVSWANEEYFKTFYLKENIAQTSKELKTSVLEYMDNFSLDFVIMSIFNLDGPYLKALTHKVLIYETFFGLDIVYFSFTNGLNSKTIDDNLNFLKFYDDLLYKINHLKTELYTPQKITANGNYVIMNYFLFEVISKEQLCSIKNKEQMLNNINNAKDKVYDFNNIRLNMKLKTFNIEILNLKQFSENIKEKISACK